VQRQLPPLHWDAVEAGISQGVHGALGNPTSGAEDSRHLVIESSAWVPAIPA
jgi:hypothetical protein